MNAFTPIQLGRSDCSLSASVIPFGLTIHSLSTQSDEDLLVGPHDPHDHCNKGRCFFGSLVGRFANRLPAGKSQFATLSGHPVEIDVSPWGGDGISHHGGPSIATEQSSSSDGQLLQKGPFDRAIWQHIPTCESQLFQDAGFESNTDSLHSIHSSAIFALESPHLDNGYPGKLRVETLFTILPSSGADPELGTSAGKLFIQYRAKLVDDVSNVVATPLNLTQHWGFNLSASAAHNSNNSQASKEEGRVDQHVLEIYPIAENPVYRLDLDSNMVANGKLLPTSGKDETQGNHDWSVKGGKQIQHGMPSAGYDHFYVWGINPQALPNQKPHDTLCSSLSTRRLRLTSLSAARSLTFHTNQTGAQLYTANGQLEAPADPQTSGGVAKHIHQPNQLLGNAKRSAAFIEFGGPHAGFLRPGLADVGGKQTLLEKGNVYDNWVVCEAWTG